MEAQDEEDAEAGGETIEIQGMRELAQLPQHQQVLPRVVVFCFMLLMLLLLRFLCLCCARFASPPKCWESICTRFTTLQNSEIGQQITHYHYCCAIGPPVLYHAVWIMRKNQKTYRSRCC